MLWDPNLRVDQATVIFGVAAIVLIDEGDVTSHQFTLSGDHASFENRVMGCKLIWQMSDDGMPETLDTLRELHEFYNEQLAFQEDAAATLSLGPGDSNEVGFSVVIEGQETRPVPGLTD